MIDSRFVIGEPFFMHVKRKLCLLTAYYVNESFNWSQTLPYGYFGISLVMKKMAQKGGKWCFKLSKPFPI